MSYIRKLFREDSLGYICNSESSLICREDLQPGTLLLGSGRFADGALEQEFVDLLNVKPLPGHVFHSDCS